MTVSDGCGAIAVKQRKRKKRGEKKKKGRESEKKRKRKRETKMKKQREKRTNAEQMLTLTVGFCVLVCSWLSRNAAAVVVAVVVAVLGGGVGGGAREVVLLWLTLVPVQCLHWCHGPVEARGVNGNQRVLGTVPGSTRKRAAPRWMRPA